MTFRVEHSDLQPTFSAGALELEVARRILATSNWNWRSGLLLVTGAGLLLKSWGSLKSILCSQILVSRKFLPSFSESLF
jgi:hypothetical protein